MTSNVTEHISNPEEPTSEAVRVRRGMERANYTDDLVHEIIDAGLVAHVGTVREGKPVVIPMFCVRDGNSLLLHGAPASGVVRRAKQGIDVCITMTLLDGLVMARSAFHHSVNYRSVVVIGEALPITDEAEKTHALDQFIERLAPGRSAELRPTNDKEFRGTEVLKVYLEQASTKVRTGPPVDDEADYSFPVWAGVVPVTTAFGTPQPDPKLNADIPLPDHISNLSGRTL
jgi:uncharacterized protein